MIRSSLAATAVALTLIMASGVGPALAAGSGSGDALTLSTDIGINSDSSVQTYQQTGVVSAEVSDPQMSVTIATERDQLGLDLTMDPLDGSTRNDFVRINHKEDIQRTVKIPIRAEYWEPFPRENLESLTGDHTATLTPIQEDGQQYTLLTVTFESNGTAVFPLPEDAVAVYSAAERTEKRTNDTIGVSLGLTPTPWNRIDSSVLSGNQTSVRIEGNPEEIMIQYNAGTPQDPEWLLVPEEPTDTDPVYRLQRDGVENAVYIVSTSNETPEIRYKEVASTGDKAAAWYREAKNLPSDIMDGLGIDGPDVDIPFLTISTLDIMAVRPWVVMG